MWYLWRIKRILAYVAWLSRFKSLPYASTTNLHAALHKVREFAENNPSCQELTQIWINHIQLYPEFNKTGSLDEIFQPIFDTSPAYVHSDRNCTSNHWIDSSTSITLADPYLTSQADTSLSFTAETVSSIIPEESVSVVNSNLTAVENVILNKYDDYNRALQLGLLKSKK